MIVALHALAAATDAEEITPGTARLLARIGLLVLLACGAAIGAIVVSRLARRMKKDAGELGWVYRREGTPVPLGAISGFPFQGLASGDVEHEISGQWRGADARAFILHSIPHGFSGRFSVTMMGISTPTPLVEIHPRTNFQRNFDGSTDVTTGSPEFDKRWRVMSRDPQFARALLTPALMERLLADRSAEIPIAIENSVIFTWSPVHRAARRDIRTSLDLLTDVAIIVADAAGRFVRDGAADPAASAPPPVEAAKPKKSRRFLAVLSLILPLTFVLAPVGIVCGHAAIRACRRGEANNYRYAVIGLWFGYGIVAIFVVAMLLSEFAY